MCTVDKMLIKGIRSFSPDNQNVIEFYRPLTLIVGSNGAGKTTIIECLKQACTGELPPNCRSGQSFVHDPKIAGETEVKAQIKLRFRTASSQPVVVVRCFQLLQKKTSLQYKALDQVLQTFNKDTGQKEALSYRCSDIDRIVPSLMGVSKAILENVIFVHQEDSNWPLAEGQVLKKKFDDIFAATKYTKALEALRKLRTEKVQEVKEMKLKLDHLKTHKDMAAKLNGEKADGMEKSRQFKLQIQDIEREIQSRQSVLSSIDTKLSRIADFGDELKELKTQHDMMAQQNADTLARLTAAYGAEDLDISEDELEQWARELDPQMEDMAGQLRRVGRDISSKRMEVEAIKEQHTREVKLQGRLTAEAEAHARNVGERDKFIRTWAAQSGIMTITAAPGAPLPADVVSGFTAALHQQVNTAAANLEQMKLNNRKVDDDLGAFIDGVTRQIASHGEAARMKTEQLARNENRLEQLHRQLEGCVVSQAMISEVNAREAAAKANTIAKQQALVTAKFDGAVMKHNAAVDELNRKATQLRQERDKLAFAGEGATRLRYKKQEVLAKQGQVDQMMGGRRVKLDALLGTRGQALPAAEKLREAIESALSSRKSELSEKGDELRDVTARLASCEGVSNTLRGQVSSLQGELSSLRTKITAGTQQVFGMVGDDSPLPRLSDEVESERVKNSENLQRVNALEISIRHHKKHAMEAHSCPTCGKGLNGQQEMDEFMDRQDENLRSIPMARTNLERTMKDTERKLGVLKQLQPLWLRYEALREVELPALQQRLMNVDRELEVHKGRQDELQGEFAVMDVELQEGQKLLQEVGWPVDRLCKEIAERQSEVNALEVQLMAVQDGRTVGDVDAELDTIEANKMAQERAKEEVMRKQGRMRDEVTVANSEWHKVREEAMRMMTQAERRTTLQHQVNELESHNASLRDQIASADMDRKPLEEQRQQYSRERDAKRAESATREAEAESVLRELRHAADTLASKSSVVDEYDGSNKAEQLSRVNESIVELKRRHTANETKIQELENQKREMESREMTQDETKRQIDDLLKYKHSLTRQHQIGDRIDAVNTSIGEVGDQDALMGQFKGLQGEIGDLQRKGDMMRGALDTVQQNVERAQRDLGAAQYRDIGLRYRKQLIELKTTEMANSDLEKYHKALEKALLSFHTTKMADINKIIKELWQKTYRNSDIDYIQIKADADGQRSYNYRVVMVNGGVELDMRGRCSAGQKVLACLVIRLALAETFCLHCGILALDEPTTNLDAANSESLAAALRSIMLARRQQANFQLIVITHDENFANLIGTREHAEYMWRITKDDNAHSLISQEGINA